MTAGDQKMSVFLQWRDELRKKENDCPWPGPRPLRESDGARMLVGRERDRRLFNHEVQNHRLILLGGESGVGKSSLLNAGLVRDLRSAAYTVVVCRNWGADVATDDEAFLAHAVHSSMTEALQSRFSDDPTLFAELNREFGDSLVIVFDQFEELLRYNRDRKDRINQILLRLHQRYATRVVLSFRSEYLHELKDIEAGATPFGISRYILEALDDKHAYAVISTTRGKNSEAIEPGVAKDLAESWTRARGHEAGLAGRVTRVGMLHLQAMLYALHDRAHGHVIDERVLADLRAKAGGAKASDADLFAFGLQEAVSVKLHRCEAAAHRDPPVEYLDRFLIRGAATALRRTVVHLSSGGYKLVREADDLAETVLAYPIEACFEAFGGGEPFDGDARSDAKAALSRLLLAIAEDALREVDEASVTGGHATKPDTGAGMTAPRSVLAAKADKRTDERSEPGGLSWSVLLERGDGADAPNNPAAGPMRGRPPAAVVIEEMRRFAWALVWLKESNLVRITRHGQQSMVSLIHDGFGDALLKWAGSYKRRDRAWALYALTAPSGVSHDWTDSKLSWLEPDGTEVTIQNELSGSGGRPLTFGNLCFKGNSIMHARFVHTVFVNCDFRGILFLECTFEGATFVNCQLDGALFSDCTVIGKPEPAADTPKQNELKMLVPEAPKFNIPDATTLARTFRHYRNDGLTADSHLISYEAGKPAEAVDEPLTESDQWLPWTSARAGLVTYGSRISALTFRGTKFQKGGTISFRGVTGSGLDLAELAGARLEFHRCLLRHVAFTAGQNPKAAKLDVVVTHSVLAQWWFGDRFKGSVSVVGSRLVDVWNDSAQLRTTIDDGSRQIDVMGPDRTLASDDLRNVIGRTDYRRT
jgi:uncharacterized protein YjbI with pentapeptide repeats